MQWRILLSLFCFWAKLKLWKSCLYFVQHHWWFLSSLEPLWDICYKVCWTVLAVSFPPQGWQEDGSIICTFPLIPDLKSNHVITFPSSAVQALDIRDMSSDEITWSQTFTPLISPIKDWRLSNPPPTESCSCPSTTAPPPLITWSTLRPDPWLTWMPSL